MQISITQKKILSILADGAFHSGTELASRLGLSRSAIWKQLDFLSDLELGYVAVKGKGYRLDRSLQLLDEGVLYKFVDERTRAMISQLEIHDVLPSTNTYLSGLSMQPATPGYVCIAEKQSAGRGRRGRQWISPYGNNVYLSILWRFQSGPAAISALSLAVGVAVIRALKVFNIDGLGLKWPNDIYSRGRKLGGILIEVTGESDGPCAAVIGLGLNLFLSEREAEGIDQAWTDLSRISTFKLDRNRLVAVLLIQLCRVLESYENLGIKAYLSEWRSYDCLFGERAKVFIGGHEFEGAIAGIDDQGLLLMRHADGTVRAFASGELSFSG